jgi:ATP-binding protein involved in chromosome partitioning
MSDTAAMRTADTIDALANAGEITEARVLDALRVVEDPDLHRDIVTLGFVKDVKICDGNVAFKVELTTPACPVKDLLKMQAHDAVAALPGVTHVAVEMTAQVRGQKRTGQELIPKVRHVIAVASGKGGVGKSTVAVNLAVALAQMGAKVGLMDADIYGPSLPLMMGVDKKPLLKDTPDGPKMIPVACHGVLMISLGFLLDPDKAVIWRGPMVAGTVRQLLADVLWGEQDYLIVDLPPGTGDAPLTLAQQVPISGVVVVMTPQTVAQEIANKAIQMFRTVGQGQGRAIPILGVVENMSGGVFGSGGGETAATRLNVPFLGRVPLDPTICGAGDAGVPAILVAPDSEQAQSFRDIARTLAAQVSILQYAQEQSEPGE